MLRVLDNEAPRHRQFIVARVDDDDHPVLVRGPFADKDTAKAVAKAMRAKILQGRNLDQLHREKP